MARPRIKTRRMAPGQVEAWLRILFPLAAVLFALSQLAPIWRPYVMPEPRTEAVDHHFSGCDEARAAGMTNIPSTDPSYRPWMDGDGDGLACEPHRY